LTTATHFTITYLNIDQLNCLQLIQNSKKNQRSKNLLTYMIAKNKKKKKEEEDDDDNDNEDNT